MDNPDKDPNFQVEWDDRKESLWMRTVLTGVFAACAVIAAIVYDYDRRYTQLAANDTTPPAISTPALPNPSVPAMPQ
jgi:hypothetical protein